MFVRADADGAPRPFPGEREHPEPGARIRRRRCVPRAGWGRRAAFAYVDQSDQRVWLCNGPSAAPGSAAPRPLSAPAPEGSAYRHGGLSATADGRWVLAVREAHTDDRAAARNAASSLSPRPAASRWSRLCSTGTTSSAPLGWTRRRRASPSWSGSTRTCQWDASSLVVVPLGRAGSSNPDDAALVPAGTPWVAAGGPEESIGQPAWRRDGRLRFVSDRRGWWQPYVHPGTPDATAADRAAHRRCGRVPRPDWVLGQTHDGGAARRDGRGTADVGRPRRRRAPSDRQPHPNVLAQPCVSIAGLCAHGDGVALIGSTPDTPTNVWVDRAGRATAAPANRRRRSPAELRPEDLAHGEPFTVTGRTGRAGARDAVPARRPEPSDATERTHRPPSLPAATRHVVPLRARPRPASRAST